ncbi:MAG: hypothetical protein JJU11_16000 [Candidatus Sumerlaeia bacterium]|nr:hypothetical protein [Candidatus Sumerlaeia bacterium]
MNTSVMQPLKFITFIFLLGAMVATSGCASKDVKLTGKVVITPVLVARDIVDLPLVSLSTLFIYWASRSDPFAPPRPGVGWSWKGGFDFGISYGLGWFFFSALAVPIATVDYIVCRSFFPAFPICLKPWKKQDQSWGDLLFPNTRALWGTSPPKTIWEERAPPPRQPQEPSRPQPQNI